MLEIIPANNSKRWNEIVRSLPEYDFYHLAEYHGLDLSGKALLLHFPHKKGTFVLPVLLREIDGTDYRDITSVYGYAGPLSSENNPDPEALRSFHEALKHYFDTQRVVSVFSRLHPLFEKQTSLVDDLGKVTDTNLTVGIDLSLPPAEQRSQYAHSLKNDINRLNKSGLTIKKAENTEEIDWFRILYYESMKRVNAAEMYYFPPSYFYDFLSGIDSEIRLAYYQGIPISGSLFTRCNGIIQVHLSATQSDYLSLSPLKSVWDQIRIFGTENQLKHMHLGGGFGGKNDSLLAFKAQFSKQRFMFKVWSYIHNREMYERFVKEKFGRNIPETAFFPLYRF